MRKPDSITFSELALCGSLLIGALLLSACSPEAENKSRYSTVKPELLRAIDNSILSVIVRINDTGPDYTGEQLNDGTWQVRLDIELDTSHTFVASWYGSVDARKILLVEQRGEFFASSTSMSAQATTIPTSIGEARFDNDCDGMSNLFEVENGSNPLSTPGCNGNPAVDQIDDQADDQANDQSNNQSSDQTSNQEQEPIISSSPTPSQTLPDMVDIPAGCFLMGNVETDPFYKPDQRQHQVCINAFSMSRYEITFDQYAAFADSPGIPERVPDDKTWGKGSRPVLDVTWLEAVTYTQWLSDTTGHTYRLPTEAEWEYAARAGTSTRFWTGDTLRDDQEHFNSADPYGGGVATGQPDRDKTRPVGSLQANPFGLYDMLGNVIEHTCSEYSDTYAGGIENECGSETAAHVVRGAAYSYIASWAHVYHRTQQVEPNARNGHVGFRVVRVNP